MKQYQCFSNILYICDYKNIYLYKLAISSLFLKVFTGITMVSGIMHSDTKMYVIEHTWKF